jgi:hypothetical protein
LDLVSCAKQVLQLDSREQRSVVKPRAVGNVKANKIAPAFVIKADNFGRTAIQFARTQTFNNNFCATDQGQPQMLWPHKFRPPIAGEPHEVLAFLFVKGFDLCQVTIKLWKSWNSCHDDRRSHAEMCVDLGRGDGAKLSRLAANNVYDVPPWW